MTRRGLIAGLGWAWMAGTLAAQTAPSAQAPPYKSPSPPGTAAAQVDGTWEKDGLGRSSYQGGKWIEVTYSRPILRQRANIFGSGPDYARNVITDGAEVWRAGANVSTRFKTEVALTFDGKPLPAGEYSLFVDLKEKAWTLIFSNWAAQPKPDPKNKDALWGSFAYTPDKDVLRTRMKVEALPFSMDEMTIAFADVTKVSGRLLIMWDKIVASAAFTVAAK